MVLSGWKDIAEYLRCSVRTVQRWERKGLPVHRPVPGKRAHVVTYSEELDSWLRDHETHRALPDNLVLTIARATRLCEAARINHNKALTTLRQTVAVLRTPTQSRIPFDNLERCAVTQRRAARANAGGLSG